MVCDPEILKYCIPAVRDKNKLQDWNVFDDSSEEAKTTWKLILFIGSLILQIHEDILQEIY